MKQTKPQRPNRFTTLEARVARVEYAVWALLLSQGEHLTEAHKEAIGAFLGAVRPLVDAAMAHTVH